MSQETFEGSFDEVAAKIESWLDVPKGEVARVTIETRGKIGRSLKLEGLWSGEQTDENTARLIRKEGGEIDYTLVVQKGRAMDREKSLNGEIVMKDVRRLILHITNNMGSRLTASLKQKGGGRVRPLPTSK